MCVYVYLGQGLVVGNINPSNGLLLFSMFIWRIDLELTS